MLFCRNHLGNNERRQYLGTVDKGFNFQPKHGQNVKNLGQWAICLEMREKPVTGEFH
jgi:hypothetical protein